MRAWGRSVAVWLMVLGPLAFAEDGLVVQFTISERAADSDSLHTYTNAILMRFDEEASFQLDGRYVLKIRSHRDGPNTLDLLLTLKDVIDGKPYYVGARPVSLDIGDAAELEFESNGRVYGLSLDTSYGRLPPEASGQSDSR